jgi:nucleotide-binding universal stress UspA family protein
MNKKAAGAARATLMDAARAADVPYVTMPKHGATTSCSFREMEGFFPQCLADASRLSDLIVFGPVSPADGPDLADAFVEALLKTERPVLLASKAPKTLTGHVTLAWDGSAVAARALVGAMPFFEQAQKITLLSCHPPSKAKPECSDVEEYFTLHGLSCSQVSVDPGKQGIGAALLASAIERGSDLLVMGGFGHSHLSEAFFGGVTQHIRWNAELPVLMVH